MNGESICFVCQSKSKPQSADGSSNTKRRKTNNIYNNLDPSTWKVFCRYFYPPPLVGLLEASSSTNSPENEYHNEEDSSSSLMPVFCDVCYQTILNLCNLDSQLELIQRQISKIVAQVSLAFVQEEEDNHDNEHEDHKNSKSYDSISTPIQRKRKNGNQRCDDNLIFSMRRRIRQRYQPLVCITRSKLNIVPRQKYNKDFEVGESSPLSIHSDNLNSDVDFDDTNLSRPIKQGADDNSIHEIMESGSRKLSKNRKNRKLKKNKIMKSSEDESDGNYYQDSDYDPESDRKLVVGRKKPKGQHSIKKDPKVGENIYEYGGKWRYERKLEEDGKYRLYCLSCDHNALQRYRLIDHIKQRHVKEVPLRREKTQKIDDDNFIYAGSYSITRVTEPNGIFYKCGECGTLRKTIMILKAHLKDVHIEPNKWVCEKCGYSCSQKHKLLFHMDTHAEDKKYICETCGKSFKTRGYLADHMEGHTGLPFFCECGKGYQYRNGLKRHRRKAGHPAPKVGPTPDAPFTPKICSFCKKEFVTEESMQKHSAHCLIGVKTPCGFCGGVFARLDIHQRLNCKGLFKFDTQNSTEDRGNMDVEEMPLSFVEVEVGEGAGQKDTEDFFGDSFLP